MIVFSDGNHMRRLSNPKSDRAAALVVVSRAAGTEHFVCTLSCICSDAYIRERGKQREKAKC